MIGDPGSPELRNILDSIRAFDLLHEILDPPAAQSRYPQHRLRDGEVIVLDKQAGFVHPARRDQQIEVPWRETAREHDELIIGEVR